MRGAGDDLVHLTFILRARYRAGPVERQIARRLGMNLRASFFSASRATTTQQFLVFDRDQIGGVLRQSARLRDNDRDRLADEQTRCPASAGRNGWIISLPPRPGIGGLRPANFKPAAVMSSAVRTASTPWPCAPRLC